MKYARVLLILLVLGTSLRAKDTKPNPPENGVIPDEVTAVAVANQYSGPSMEKITQTSFCPTTVNWRMAFGLSMKLCPTDRVAVRLSCESTCRTAKC